MKPQVRLPWNIILKQQAAHGEPACPEPSRREPERLVLRQAQDERKSRQPTRKLLFLLVALLLLAAATVPHDSQARPLAQTEEYRLLRIIGGLLDGQLDLPYGVAVDGAGQVYVSDTNNHRIQAFDAQGTFLRKWGSFGSADGRFLFPYGVEVDAASQVYVADTNNHRIQVFDAQGTFLRKWGRRGSSDGQFYYPYGVAVDGAGQVYVSDTNNHRIQAFDAQGTFLRKWGSFGSADGQFWSPRGVAVDGAGQVYLADTFNHRIQVFDAQGAFLRKWGSYGTADGQLSVPSGVAVDGAGQVYVTDSINQRIQVFDAQGNFLRKWGTRGSADGQFSVPSGVAVDGAGLVYVADSGNPRIQVFASTAVMPFPDQPPDGTRLTALGAALRWTLPTGTTQVQIQVLPINNDGPGINLIRNAETNYAIPPPVMGQGNYVMLPGMTYSWRVRATSKSTFAPEDDPSWGPWSSSWTFRTPPPSSATISPVFPANGATVASTVPLALSWSNTATDIFYYEVQASPDTNFGEQGAVASVWHNLVHGGVTVPLNSWLTPQLQSGTVYYWRVRPRVQGDGTPVAWSAMWSFRTP